MNTHKTRIVRAVRGAPGSPGGAIILSFDGVGDGPLGGSRGDVGHVGDVREQPGHRALTIGVQLGTVAAGTTAAQAPAAGTNIGAQGPNDPVVPAATAHARKVANQKVDWKHPENALRQLSQFDGKAEKGGSDPVRCGAAVVVAAGILNGPVAFKAGLERIVLRADDVSAKLESLSRRDPESAKAQLAGNAKKNVEKAIGVLDRYSQMSAEKLTNGDMSKIQDAIYSIAHADQLIEMDGSNVSTARANNEYLSTSAMGEYYKLMTGAEAPLHNGKTVQPYHVTDGNGHGHFVLADEQGNVAYNPWPEANGKAFSRSAGGAGPKIVGGAPGTGELQGSTVWSNPSSLPARVVTDEDAASE